MIVHALMLAALLAPLPSADWIPLGETASGHALSVNAVTLKMIGGERRMWTRIDWAKPKPDGAASSDMYLAVKCDTDEYRVLATIRRTAEGASATPPLNTPYAALEPIPPDSIVQSFTKVVCGLNL